MSATWADCEAMAAAMIADAQARAKAIPHKGVRVAMVKAAERRAARVMATAAPARPCVAKGLRDLDGAPVERKSRPCLCCEKPFLSHGPGNRMCDGCRGKDLSPYAPC